MSDRAAADTIVGEFRTINLVARSGRDTGAMIGALRAVLQQLDSSLPTSNAGPLADVVSHSVKPQRFSTTVVGLFALVALGATASTVVWTVLRRALLLMTIGVVIGIAGALALTRVTAGLLYEVRPTDGATFGGAALLLGVLALVGSLVPAWRATRVDPLVALRAD